MEDLDVIADSLVSLVTAALVERGLSVGEVVEILRETALKLDEHANGILERETR